MKKYAVFTLSLLLLLVGSLPAYATKSISPKIALEETPAMSEEEIQHYAYMDLEAEKAKLEGKIILARNQIIFSTGHGWCADGQEGSVGDARTGKVLYSLPQFSELFPGWDVPKDTVTEAAQKAVPLSELPQTQEEIRHYAYLDLEKAVTELEEKILSARKEIIYRSSWVADEFEGAYIGDARTGEVVEVLPKFSEMFPGWDLPVEDASAISEEEEVMPLADDRIYRSVYLQRPNTAHDTEPFYTSYTAGVTEFRAYATQLPGETCNLGFTNMMGTQESLTYANKLAAWQYLSWPVKTSVLHVGVRASTYSTVGMATIAVEKFD